MLYSSFGKLGNRASECFWGVQGKSRKKYCYRCGGTGYTFMLYEKRVSSLLLGQVQKKAYKVRFAVPVKRLNPVEADKQ